MTSGINPAFLDELRSKVDIVDVASRYMTLTRRGGSFWACCPFHSEKTPSFSIKQDGQFFKCFGCGESGNVFTLLRKLENVDFITAVEMLCKMYNIEPPKQEDNAEAMARKKQRDNIYKILKSATEFYHNNLINNPNSLQAKYLCTRKLSQEMIEKFQIGASLNYDDLPQYLLKQGFNREDMIAAGVVGKNANNDGLYDFYGKRLIFPIFNGFGDVVGYSGRSVEQSPDHTKYKNTTQTPVFNKSEILFAYNFVRELKKSRMLDTIIIVEGHIDAIACHQVGITNTIACMGTALTTQHARKIKQLADNVILCLDGDSAGKNATYKAIDVLKEVGLNVRVVRLVGAKDPDEYIKKFGKDALLEEFNKAADCVDFVLTDSAKKYDLTKNNDKAKYLTEALNYISKLSTEAEQEVYLNLVHQLVKVPLDALRKSLKGSAPVVAKSAEQEKSDTPSNKFLLDSKIMILASIIFKKADLEQDFATLFTGEDELSQLYKFVKSKGDVTASCLFDNFEVTKDSLIDKVINYQFPPDDVFKVMLNDAVRRVKVHLLEQEKARCQSALIIAGTDEERLKYLKRIQELATLINKEKM